MSIYLRALFALALLGPCSARDLGQWQDSSVKEWYESLMQPDHPAVSCCGEADAYWCDDVHVRDGRTYCAITDDRPDEPRRRKHIDVGTEIFIPDNKLKWDRSNPTGHAIVFLSSSSMYGTDGEAIPSQTEYLVYCFVQSGGV